MLRIRLMTILAAISLLHALPASAQKGALSFESTLWNFGTISESEGSVMHTFSFRNHGSSTIRLDRVSVSCSCVKVYMGETSFGPGESGELSVSFNPDGLSGDQQKTVTIFTDGPKYTLDIKGKIVNQRVNDGYAVNLGNGLRARTMDISFGVIYPGERFLRVLSLWNTSDKAVEVSAMGMPSSVTVFGAGSIPAGEMADLSLVFELPSSSTAYGSLSEKFWLNVNGTPLTKPVSISARCIERTERSASVKPRMELSSKELILKKFFWQSAASASIEISNSGTGPLRVHKVETEGVSECSLASGTVVPAGRSVKLSVSVAGDSGIVRIFTNDPVRPYMEIPCKAK